MCNVSTGDGVGEVGLEKEKEQRVSTTLAREDSGFRGSMRVENSVGREEEDEIRRHERG